MASFFHALSGGTYAISPLFNIWKLKAPFRVMAFAWLAVRGAILAMDNLRRRKRIIVNACHMCLAAEESVDYLLLNCKIAHCIWKSILGSFGVSGVLPAPLLGHFKAWKFVTSSQRGKIMWSSSFYLAIWCMWKERNTRCFEGRSNREEVLIDKIESMMSIWFSTFPMFQGFYIDLMMLNWSEVAFSWNNH